MKTAPPRPLRTQLRVTRLRTQLIDILSKSSVPLSADEILIALETRRTRVHKTSVYRQIETLEKNNILRMVQLGEKKKRYELFSAGHHHHIVCVTCGKVEDVCLNNDLTAIESKIQKQKKFIVTHHSLEFFGHCTNCHS